MTRAVRARGHRPARTLVAALLVLALAPVTGAHATATSAAASLAPTPAADDVTVRPAAATTGVSPLRDLRAACPTGRVPTAGFTDTASSGFAREIDCLAWYGITQGVRPGVFDPSSGVTRRQMAVFLYRLLEQSVWMPAVDPAAAPAFPDVARNSLGYQEIAALTSPQAQRLFGTRIVAGGTDGRFRPNERVSRAQMASFLARTVDAVAYAKGADIDAATCSFTDVADIPVAHRANARRLCGLGVAAGRTDGRFAPSADVTRGQMAAFQVRVQDIVVDDGMSYPPDEVVPLWVDNLDCVVSGADGSADASFCTIQAAVDHAAARLAGVYPVLLVVDHSDRDASSFYDEDVVIPAGLDLAIVGENETYGYTSMYGSFTVEGDSELDLAHFTVHTRDRDAADPDGVGLLVAEGGAVGLYFTAIFNRGAAIHLDDGAQLVMLHATAGDSIVALEIADGDALLVTSSLVFSDVGAEVWEDGTLRSYDTHYEHVRVGVAAYTDLVDVVDGEFHVVEGAYVQDHSGGLDLSAMKRANVFDVPARTGWYEGVRALVPIR